GTELDALFGAGCPMRIGVHWGPSLYMGQLVTDGRLGVSAFGDEVNQCARLEEAASRGQTLASKTLIEQLDDSDAATLQLEPDSLRYTAVSALAGVSEKAKRDAGGIPVTAIEWGH
ncbi:MAG: adenylate/guanylate cyclase domain-containing protein, partial [Actinomycetota bacterium]